MQLNEKRLLFCCTHVRIVCSCISSKAVQDDLEGIPVTNIYYMVLVGSQLFWQFYY